MVSAAELPTGYIPRLEQALSIAVGKQVRLTHRVDPDLIGGVVTKVGDQTFDGSVKHRLSELREALISAE